MTDKRELPLSIAAVSETNGKDISAARKKRKRWIVALYVSSIGGISFGATGLIISGLTFLGVIERTRDINLVGALLVTAAFPLLVSGAHAIDKIAEIDRNEKLRTFETEQKRKLYSPEQWKTQ